MKSVLFQKVPEDIYREFKSKCIMNGTTVKDTFVKLMSEYSEKSK